MSWTPGALTPPALLAALALLPALASSCIVDDPLPELGDCSEPPGDGPFEYGQVGIGTCIASPSDLRVRPDPLVPGNYFVFVVNSNSRANFTGSSLLSVDASSVDLSCPRNGMHEVAASALTMQEFAGRVDFDDETGLALLSRRYAGGFEGDLSDVVFTIDAADPRALAWSDAGPHAWGPYRWIGVPADPWSVRFNPFDGRAWVLGLTTHTVSALDVVSRPIGFIDLRGERDVGGAVFEDADGSGSAPDFELLAYAPSLLREEDLRLLWQGGSFRLYYGAAAADGALSLFQADSADGADFHVLAGGPLLRPWEDWAAGGLRTAAVALVDGALVGLATGRDEAGVDRIGSISSLSSALDWWLADAPLLEPLPGGWDEGGLRDPDLLLVGGVWHAYFGGGAGLGTAIGHAAGAGLSSLARAGDAALGSAGEGMVLAPGAAADFDAVSVSAPAILRHPDSGEWLLYYAGHADAAALPDEVPEGLGIGLARSPDAVVFSRETGGAGGGGAAVLEGGAPGDWDGQGVAAPSVLFDHGRFHMWYQGFDGFRWRTGHATSLDGVAWEKDAQNPVFDGRTSDGEEPATGLDPSPPLPRRAFAYKASPGGFWTVEGDVTGPVPQVAFEGTDYTYELSPIQFLLVGGQALGRGAAGTLDASGAGSPSLGGADGGLVLYEGLRGSRRRVALARDEGAGLTRVGAIELAGFSSNLDDLNGSDPQRSMRDPEARDDGAGGTLLAFDDGAGILLAEGVLDPGAAASEGAPLLLTALSPDYVLQAGAAGEFDDTAVAGASLLLDAPDGALRLYYEGNDGEVRRIGMVTSGDGANWTRGPSGGLVLDRGAAGSWDDAWVGEPSVVWDEASGLYRMWFAGSDGDRTRIGTASSEDGLAWSRYTDGSGVTRPVFDGDGLAFARDGVAAPSVRALPGGGFEMWFEGWTGDVPRAGRAFSEDGLVWTPRLNPATPGDRFVIHTSPGDEDASTGIELGDDGQHARLVDGALVHGAGASEMLISPDGRFAVVANKRAPFLLVLDLFDDSDGVTRDANHLDIEAVIRIPQRRGMVGTRDLAFSPDGTELWALLAPLVQSGATDESLRFGTEGLLRIDWTQVQDEPVGHVMSDDVITGWMPLPRGNEEDRGYETEVSAGPTSMAISADGSRAYVTNFNDNSLSILDLRAGARGSLVALVRGLDENPYEVELSPDGKLAWVANSYGVQRQGVQHSTLQVVDVDEESATFGQVLTRLSNVDSRAAAGCAAGEAR